MTHVVIACHFKNRTQLCETVITRLRKVLSVAKTYDNIIVTGDVPYQKDGLTLGQPMKNWLLMGGVPENSISLLKGAVGTFSEARVGCELLRNERRIVVISSRWYLC